jgi:putrescine transport system permease protein
MIMPAVISGWLLAFTLSLDDLDRQLCPGRGRQRCRCWSSPACVWGLTQINALASIILGVVGVVGFIAWYLMAR